MPIEKTEFREIMSQFASGVVVLTVKHQDVCHGMTVSSFCSLSLEPPLVLACVNENSYCLKLIEQAGSFGINILDERSEGLSGHFSSRTASKFTDVPFRISSAGIPLLTEALATLECRLENRYPGGDHSILVGEVFNGEVAHYSQPLLYFRRNYRQIAQDKLDFSELLPSPRVY